MHLESTKEVTNEKTGDIVIKGDNISFTGLIYAPNGSVEITAQNLNLNNVILLAETVTLTCTGANINYNDNMGRFIGTAGTGGGSAEVKPTIVPTEVPVEPSVTPAVPTEMPPEPTTAPEEPGRIEFSAFGSYDDSSNTVEIRWYSNYEKGIYELYESPDNIAEYTWINTVQNTEYYLYSLGNFTGTKYIKVVLVTEEGERLESVPFSFSVTQSGAEVIPLDSDGDGVPDATELKLGMDPHQTDADGDGFSDYEELFELGTNPKKQDTDSVRDSDKDGLTNVEEYRLGTNLYSADTDGDGLTDKEELSRYGTDPLIADMDGDGLSDGDEIILGTDPKNADADGDGIPDSEEIFEQKIKEEVIASTLLEEDDAVLSELVLTTKGNVNKEVSVKEYTGYRRSEQSFYIGKTVEIKGSDMESGSIAFQLSEDYKVKEYDIGGVRTNGLLICYSDGENTIPLETEFDEATGILHAEISGEGNYFVVDVVDWLEGLGYNVTGAQQVLTDSEDIPLDTMVQIVFVVDTTSSMNAYLGNVKSSMVEFAQTLEAIGVSPWYAVVEYKDIAYDGKSSTKIRSNGNNIWLRNHEELSAQLNRLSASGGRDAEESALDGCGIFVRCCG